MSASSPESNRPGSSKVLPGFVRTHDRNRGGWFSVSLVLHILAVLVLLYCTPIREILSESLEPERPRPTMSADQLEELTKAIEVNASETLRRNVETLDHILGQIHELQTDVDRKFAEFDRERTQTAAQDALAEMTSAVQRMNEAVELLEKQAVTEEIDRAQALAEQAQERAQNKLAQIPYDVKQVQAEHVKAESSHLASKEVFTQHIQRAANDAGRQAKLDKQEANLENRRKQLDQQRASPNAKPAKLKTTEDRLKEDEQKQADAKKELETRKTETAALQPRTVKAQKEAAKAQERVIKKLTKVIEQHPQVSVTVAARESKRPESPETGEMDAPELYNTAKDAEDKVADVFKEVRAMDLAMVRDMKLQDARDDIEVVRPHRPELNAELLRQAVRTESQFQAAKDELKTALRETHSMVDLASRMLEMAQQSVDGMKFGSGAGTAPEDEGRTLLQLKIEELAMEDVSGRFSDLSEAMKAVQAAQQGGDGGGDSGAPVKKSIDYEDLTKEEPEDGQRALALGEDDQDVGGMAALTKDVPAVGARKVGAAGEPSDWMFVDTWYTLGPFPNPNRVNIDREFPPDSIIDLDANYTGKGGRTIRWRFLQTPKPEVVPANAEEYGIWYAYTELHFDEPCDVIIALGTDDRGILKINGVPVWISSKRLKNWDIDEVWRKVHFKKGVNRILYRVENGWAHIAFSMVLRMTR